MTVFNFLQARIDKIFFRTGDKNNMEYPETSCTLTLIISILCVASSLTLPSNYTSISPDEALPAPRGLRRILPASSQSTVYVAGSMRKGCSWKLCKEHRESPDLHVGVQRDTHEIPKLTLRGASLKFVKPLDVPTGTECTLSHNIGLRQNPGLHLLRLPEKARL